MWLNLNIDEVLVFFTRFFFCQNSAWFCSKWEVIRSQFIKINICVHVSVKQNLDFASGRNTGDICGDNRILWRGLIILHYAPIVESNTCIFINLTINAYLIVIPFFDVVLNENLLRLVFKSNIITRKLRSAVSLSNETLIKITFSWICGFEKTRYFVNFSLLWRIIEVNIWWNKTLLNRDKLGTIDNFFFFLCFVFFFFNEFLFNLYLCNSERWLLYLLEKYIVLGKSVNHFILTRWRGIRISWTRWWSLTKFHFNTNS